MSVPAADEVARPRGRDAPTALIFDSLRPQGYTRETFAGKTPHPLGAARIKKITDSIAKERKRLVISPDPAAAAQHEYVFTPAD